MFFAALTVTTTRSRRWAASRGVTAVIDIARPTPRPRSGRKCDGTVATSKIFSTFGGAAAQSPHGWDGGYAGLNVLGISGTSCDRWSLQDAAVGSFGSQSCTKGSGGGGIQIGENIQYGRLFWGFEGTLDARSAKSATGSVIYQGSGPPSGSYAFSGKLARSAFATIAPRFGVAGGEWMLYLKGGVLIAAGSGDTAVAYTPAGSTKAAASFSGGKGFNSVG